MEEMIPDQSQQAPEREKKPQQKKPALTMPLFLRQIGKDVKWYYDVRLWLPLVLVLVIFAACTGSNAGQNSARKEYEAVLQQMEADTRIEAEKQQEETTPPTAAPINPEAEALAVLADSVGSGRSDNVKTIIMWVAINRSENPIEGHGKPLLEEIAMPQQWQGYDPQTAYFQRTYDIALEVLEMRDNGSLRPLDRDMLWLVLNNDGSVTVRDKFQGQNIYERTIK